MTCRAVRQAPQACTRTRTAPGPGRGRSRSSRASGRLSALAGRWRTWALIAMARARVRRCRSRHDEGRLALDRGSAALLAGHEEIEVDASVTVSLVAPADRGLADEVVARPDLLAELDREPTDVVRAEPVGAVAAEDPGLEHADREDAREARGLCQL